MISHEQLSAYLDGEATPSEVQEIEAALEANAGLRDRLDRLQRGDAEVQAAMNALLERPAPDRLAQAVRAAAANPDPRSLGENVVALKTRAPLARRALWPVAIAASLVAGVMIGHLSPSGPGSVDWTSSPGGPQAGKAMSLALDVAASGAHATLASGRTMTPVMTFTSRDGSLCRQFEVAGAGGRQSGLACRADPKTWRLVALMASGPAGPAGGYRTAAGPGDDAVSAVSDRLIKGEPMDAAAEAAALKTR
jgi:negative regulator of sigma E activity